MKKLGKSFWDELEIAMKDKKFMKGLKAWIRKCENKED